MPGKYRKKPLAQFEHGTPIYSPGPGEPRFRVVATDATGRRYATKAATEDDARARAREIEQRLSGTGPVALGSRQGGPTVADLAGRYVEDHLSTLSWRFRDRQEYLPRIWILPTLGALPLTAWTAADSIGVLTSIRQAGRSSALFQDVGSTMRALVTHARRLRWLGPHSDDPMWMVSYPSPIAEPNVATA